MKEKDTGRTPLHVTCFNGRMEMSVLLIKRGSIVDGKDGIAATPLMLAAQAGHTDLTRMLLECGANIKLKDKNGWTALHHATPLHLAAEKGKLETVKVLVEAGADMGAVGFNVNGNTPLHLAAQFGHTEVCKYLVSKGASMLVQGLWTVQGTPMHIAIQYGKLNVVNCFLELGCDMEQKDKNGLTAMHVACRYKQFDIGFALIERGANLTAEAANARFCALLLAATNISGELSALTDLSIEFSDLDINIVLDSTLGGRAITRAAFNGFNVIVAALLKWDGIDINVQEKDGNTALHMAASRGKAQHKSIVEMLLLHNARIGIANNAGKTPACVAATTYLGEIIRNPRLIQTRTQMEVMSLSPQMNNSRDQRAKALGNAMATATGGSNNLISLMSSTKIGVNTSDVNAQATGNTIYSPTMHDPATSLLADAYGQNYSPVKPLMDTWKIGPDERGNFGSTKGQGAGVYGNAGGSYGGFNSNNISENKVGKNDFHYADPNTSGIAGPLPMTNEYGNIYLPPKFKTIVEVNYQRDLRGFTPVNSTVMSNGSHSGVGHILAQSSQSMSMGQANLKNYHPNASLDGTGTVGSVHTFNPENLTNTLYPEGFGDPLAKTISQYALRDADPGYIYSHTHFAETNKIAPMIDDGAAKSRPKVDMDTENFTRGKYGPVPSSFRGCREDLFFTKFATEIEEELEPSETEGKRSLRARDLVSSRLISILNEQGVDYDGEEIDALVNGNDLGIKDESRLSRITHIKFELGKIRNKKKFENVPAQASHTPTAFDISDEWIGVRDYLWLLGYPYKQNNKSRVKDKRLALKALSHSMDEMHRIFTDPSSLATMQLDPLVDPANNVNNFKRSDAGTVRGAKDIGATRSRFLNLSSEEKMREMSNEGILPNSQSHRGMQEGKGDNDDQSMLSQTNDSLSGLNNSNMEGGNAFKGVEGKVFGASSPMPPTTTDVNQFIFANQKQPTPANSLDDAGPTTLAEASDARIKQLCLRFVSDAVDVFEPADGWALPTGEATSSECAMITSRLKQVYNASKMDDDLYRSLTKLAEASSQDVTRTFQKLQAMGARGMSSGNHAMAFPPRKRRVLIDCMYDVAFAFQQRAEQDFPVDSIRAHFWAHNGRKQMTRHVEKEDTETDLTLWLRDIHLEGTINAFKQLGFKEMADFTDLILSDVQEYFPFLKIGDAIRMSRNIKFFTPELLASYKRRANTGDVIVALPLIPGLLPPPVEKKQVPLGVAGKRGPTPSKRVKAPITKPEDRPKPKKKVIVQDREPSRAEYLSGIQISDFYFKKLQERISEETDGVNLRRASDIEHSNSIIREKGLVKQVIAKLNEENKVIIMKANDIDEVLAGLQVQITKATKGFQFRLKSDLTVANEIIREAGMLGLVMCHEDQNGDMVVMKVSEIGAALDILQEQITKATAGFQMSMDSDLERANKMIKEAGMYGIVVAREQENGDIIMERLHDEGNLWELYVSSIATHDTVDLGTAMDGQDPSVKIWLGEELIGKTARVKDVGSNATFDDTFHMHMSKKNYKQEGSEIVVEVYNENIIGGLEHVGKGHVDLKTKIPEDRLNEYVDITVPLWYTLPGADDAEKAKNAVPIKDSITDDELINFQKQVTKETKGFNFRLSDDRTHANSMIKARGYQRLLMAWENPDGDIILRKTDQAMGTVSLRIMIKSEKS
eukprot:GSChrysophyteH2.ASY1.ANO1.1523.1 assembled CDS